MTQPKINLFMNILFYHILYLLIVIYICIYKKIYRVQGVNCCHLKSLISCMCFVCFRFCQLFSNLESFGHYLWGKQDHDAIYSSRNLKMICCTAWHSCQKLQYEDFSMIRCQSEDRFILMKTKHLVHLKGLGWSLFVSPFIFPHGLKFSA